ncbi:MAG: LPS assembly protein LptD [Pirellulaceae bacterium]
MWLIVGLVETAHLAAADIQMPVPSAAASITIDGESAVHWQQGAVEAWVIQRSVIRQDSLTARADEAVLWIDRAPLASQEESRVTVYLEGSVAIDFGRAGEVHANTGTAAQSIRDHSWFGRLTTRSGIEVRAPVRTDVQSVKPAVYPRAEQAWDQAVRGVRQAQFTTQPPAGLPAQPSGGPSLPAMLPTPIAQPFIAPPSAPSPSPAPLVPAPTLPVLTLQPPVFSGPVETLPPAAVAPVIASEKRVQVGPRSNSPIHIKSFPGTLPNQSVTVFSNGIRAVIEGIEAPQMGNLGRIVIETDRLVLWGPNLKTLTSAGSEAAGGADVPIEVYMEGNIVFRQGDRLIYADRMYYNATYEYGVVLAAEVFTPMPDYQGVVRLKADVLQQVNRQFFQAYGAALTTSQMGVPKYWFQAEQISFRDTQVPRVNAFTGQLEADPRTHEAAVDHDLLATSYNNFVYVGGIPVLYWPVMATDLRKPSYYLERFAIRKDDVFGTQVLADWDIFQLLNTEDPPEGTDFSLSTDYLSERGFGVGTTYEYQRDQFLGCNGPVDGWFDAWGIYDTGFDDLGANRRRVFPDTRKRGRVYWRHRQNLPDGWQVTALLGLVSDRNFLEQYYEKEWDEWVDRVTSLQLKRTWEDQSLGIRGQFHLNEYVSQTEWWPRADHFLLGRSLLQDRLTWFAHSHASYARFNVLEPPTDPQDAAGWSFLPWEQPTQQPAGARFATRQEIDLPVQAGPLKLVPYALGEVAYWGEGLDDQQDITRGYGQLGMRASFPFWKVHPTVQSMLFNLNGLAHKVTLVSDLYWADASQNIDEFPLYDPLDDDSQEHFRRYLGAFPWSRDPRNYAFRTGLQGWVASPTTEMVDDVVAARLGIHQRWQTKRGLPGQQRVVDWIVLDIDGTLFPEKERDNFGDYPGLLEYDFRWHVGDRLSILSDGYADFFPEGMKSISLGAALSRPQRGQLYGGITSLDGPFSSTLLVGAASYRLSRKWIVDLAGTYDLGETGNIGERLAITHVGESLLVRIAANSDFGRDNFGVGVAVEPRFLPKGRLGRIGDMPIPPLGTMGIE